MQKNQHSPQTLFKPNLLLPRSYCWIHGTAYIREHLQGKVLRYTLISFIHPLILFNPPDLLHPAPDLLNQLLTPPPPGHGMFRGPEPDRVRGGRPGDGLLPLAALPAHLLLRLRQVPPQCLETVPREWAGQQSSSCLPTLLLFRLAFQYLLLAPQIRNLMGTQGDPAMITQVPAPASAPASDSATASSHLSSPSNPTPPPEFPGLPSPLRQVPLLLRFLRVPQHGHGRLQHGHHRRSPSQQVLGVRQPPQFSSISTTLVTFLFICPLSGTARRCCTTCGV